MNGDIVLIYPPEKNLYLDNKKCLEISLYNKTDKKIFYIINYNKNNNFIIENNTAIIHPYQNQTLKIYLKNNKNIQYLNQLVFFFYEFNNDNNMKQKSIINIYSNDKIEEKNEKEKFNIYSNFKRDLKKINEKIKDLINREKEYNKVRKIKFNEILFLIILISILGIIIGINLAKIRKKIFNKNIANENINIENSGKDAEYEEIEFMTKEENLELQKINEQNKEKINTLFNNIQFDILDKVKENREIIENKKREKINSFEKYIKFKFFYIIASILLYI